MVGGAIGSKLIHRMSYRASVLHQLWTKRGEKNTAREFSVLTTPSLLSMRRKFAHAIHGSRSTTRGTRDCCCSYWWKIGFRGSGRLPARSPRQADSPYELQSFGSPPTLDETR